MTAPLFTPESGAAARAAALAVPGVAALDSGRFGEVALLLPGARVEGMRPSTRDARKGLEVHIVFDVSSGRLVDDVAADTRETVLAATGAPFVDVVVTDAQ